jgi:hypothetical protein
MLQDLAWETRRILDERTFAVLLEIAGDRAVPRSARFAALEVLWYYADGTIAHFTESPEYLNATPRPRAVWGIGVVSHMTPLEGNQRLVGDVPRRLVERVRALAVAPGEDAGMVIALRDLVDNFEYKFPRLKPPPS